MTRGLRIAGRGIVTKAGNCDYPAAAADVDAADGRSAGGRVSRAARACRGRDAASRALASEPRPAALFQRPSLRRSCRCRTIPATNAGAAPAPPRPGLSPPVGDMASEPVPPLLGSPTLEPGWLEITAPALGATATAGGRGEACAGVERCPEAGAAATQAGASRRTELPPTEGGGGTILLASSVLARIPAPPPLRPVPLRRPRGAKAEVERRSACPALE